MDNTSEKAFSINCTAMGPPQNRIFTPIASQYVTTLVAIGIPVVCILGFIGNIGSFIIMKESGKKLSSHFFIMVLTIFDCLSLIFFLPPAWLNLVMRPFYHHYLPGEFTWVDDFGGITFICEIRLYITFVTRTLSIHTIVAFTVERGLMVIWPYHGQRWCTMRNARITTACLILFSVLINGFCLFSFDQKVVPCSGGRVICKANALFFHYRGMMFFLLSVFPSAIILITNVAIIFTLRKRRSASYIASGDQDALKERDREITYRLLLVSTMFFILNMPLMIVTSHHNRMSLIKSKSHLRGPWADAFLITLFLFYLNLAINFILYCVTGKTFRKAAAALFTLNFEEMRRQRLLLDAPKDSSSANRTDRTDTSSRRESDMSGRRVSGSLLQSNTNQSNPARVSTTHEMKPLSPVSEASDGNGQVV